MENHTNYEMCKECGGVCCLASGCPFLPEDFESMKFEYLKKKIEEGYITIRGDLFGKFANYEAWSFYMYLKVSNYGEGIVNFLGNNAPCIMYTPNGCPFSLEERPAFGRCLKPIQIGGPCDQTIDVNQFRNEWAKYHDVLYQLVKYFTNKDAKDLFVQQISDMDHSFVALKSLPYYHPEEALSENFTLKREKKGKREN